MTDRAKKLLNQLRSDGPIQIAVLSDAGSEAMKELVRAGLAKEWTWYWVAAR